MKYKRLKNSKKKEKWDRGQSCVSNPNSFTHREAAKSRFFQKIEGESNLTEQALAEHNAALDGVSAQLDSLHVDPEDYQSAGKSFNTFATNFTTCTIPAFNRFFKSFSIESEMHTKMLAIHAAAQEYLKEANIEETPTSYLCSLMASLEGVKDSEEDSAATLSLMSRVIRSVPVEVLKVQYEKYVTVLEEVFLHYHDFNNSPLLINIIGCLSVLLKAQDETYWTIKPPSKTVDLFNKILHYTVHPRPKIRKAAQYNASTILSRSQFMLPQNTEEKEEEEIEEAERETHVCKLTSDSGSSPTSIVTSTPTLPKIHPAAGFVAKFVIAQMKTAIQELNTKSTLHLLVFLQNSIMYFPAKSITNICECLLGVMRIADTLVNVCILKVFNALFESSHSSNSSNAHLHSVLNTKVVKALLNALITASKESPTQEGLGVGHCYQLSCIIRPRLHDPNLADIWLTTVTSGVLALFRFDKKLGVAYASYWVHEITELWLIDNKQTQQKVYFCIEQIQDDCIEKVKNDVESKYKTEASCLITAIEKCLALKFESVWPFVFRSLENLYRILGQEIPSALLSSLEALCGLASNPNLQHRNALEASVGVAIRHLEPEMVLSVVPFKITGDLAEDEPCFWILPLLKKFTKQSKLCFFESYFVHLATKCMVIMDSLQQKGKGESELAMTYKIVERQIWALLPSFASEASDVDKALEKQSFAKLICDLIKTRADLRLDMLAGLRNIIKSCRDKPNRIVIYAKNYLPTLFNLYLSKPISRFRRRKDQTIENEQRLAAFDTIKVYLEITPQVKCEEFLELILQRYAGTLKGKNRDSFTQCSLLHLTRLFLPHINNTMLARVWTILVPLMKQTKHMRKQKAAYRMLEKLLSADSKESTEFVKSKLVVRLPSILQSTHSTVAPNARGARLRCLCNLFDLFQKFGANRTKIRKLLQNNYEESDNVSESQTDTNLYDNTCEMYGKDTLDVDDNDSKDDDERYSEMDHDDDNNYSHDTLINIPAMATSIVSRGTNFVQMVVVEAVLCVQGAIAVGTKKAAFALLSQVTTVRQALLKWSPVEAMEENLKLLLIGLTGPPELVSNTILALRAHMYYYKDLITEDVLEDLITSVSLLFMMSRPIVKSALIFTKSFLLCFPIAVTSNFVEIIVKGLTTIDPNTVSKYRSKVKNVFSILLRKFGDDRLIALIPSDSILIKPVKRLSKARRRKARHTNDGMTGNEENEEEEEEEEEEEMSGTATSLDEILTELDEELVEKKESIAKTSNKPKRKAQTWIKDGEDSIIDLLDESAGTYMSARKPQAKKIVTFEDEIPNEDKYGFKIDKTSGKYIILNERNRRNASEDNVDGNTSTTTRLTSESSGLFPMTDTSDASSGLKKKRKLVSDHFENNKNYMDDDDDAASIPKSILRRRGSSNNSDTRPLKRPRFDYGSEYRAKKAKGDVTKKGGQAPYAYVQFTKERLNKRKKAKYAGQFKSLVRGATRGAKKGIKLKTRKL